MGPETLDDKVALVTGFQVLGGASIILTTATSGKAISPRIGGLRARGRMIVVGAAPDPIEVATLLAACDDDPTLLRRLVQDSRAHTPGALARVREAVQERDAPRLGEAAHRLRGLLSTFSAPAEAAAARLETMGAGGRLDEAAATLDGLTEMVGRLGAQLEDLSLDQLRHATNRLS
jgi:Hpt domain